MHFLNYVGNYSARPQPLISPASSRRTRGNARVVAGHKTAFFPGFPANRGPPPAFLQTVFDYICAPSITLTIARRGNRAFMRDRPPSAKRDCVIQRARSSSIRVLPPATYTLGQEIRHISRASCSRYDSDRRPAYRNWGYRIYLRD